MIVYSQWQVLRWIPSRFTSYLNIVFICFINTVEKDLYRRYCACFPWDVYFNLRYIPDHLVSTKINDVTLELIDIKIQLHAETLTQTPFHDRRKSDMIRVFFLVVLPCVLARKTQFVVDTVQAAPTDVVVRLEILASSKMTCSTICSTNDYVSFTFTLATNACHCFFEISEQVEQDVIGTSGIFFGKKEVLVRNTFQFTRFKHNCFFLNIYL